MKSFQIYLKEDKKEVQDVIKSVGGGTLSESGGAYIIAKTSGITNNKRC